MLLTTLLRAKVKTKHVMVMCESVATGHRINLLRERTADKMEFIRYDPLINQDSLYKEIKKIKSVKIVLKAQKEEPNVALLNEI
ncbi:39S ribosomal protein L33, mitochondrial [Thrips palmi]|uniref:Large ribosomal subunit protein bL33m n=1 Tax=Thrips palmi TaxID=161013 RepID=A0A6P8YLW6_THRPL|nr:39S ribosomal protein L33, mitochondrial [Thrips palmi]